MNFHRSVACTNATKNDSPRDRKNTFDVFFLRLLRRHGGTPLFKSITPVTILKTVVRGGRGGVLVHYYFLKKKCSFARDMNTQKNRDFLTQITSPTR